MVETRARGLGIETQVVDRDDADFSSDDISGILVQYPDTNGSLWNMQSLVHHAHQHKVQHTNTLYVTVKLVLYLYVQAQWLYYIQCLLQL